jgi:hypothetical protein
MRIGHFLYVGLLASTIVPAADDTFVGTWVYNIEKSPKPTITFTIKDLGANRISLTGSTNKTIILKADGKPVNVPSGGTGSLKRLSDTKWEEIRIYRDTLVRTLSVSADDKTMMLVDVYTFVDGVGRKDITKYSRISPGKGLFGEWRSISMENKQSGEPSKLIIEPYSKNGLSFSFPRYSRVDMNFDGKMYPVKGPGIPKPTASSGKRAGPHVLQLESHVDGKVDEKEELRLSDDGKTMTVVTRPVTSSAVFTYVYDRH